MATMPNPLDEALQDFQFPQREAAFFYGLFLRGHSADELRRDIRVVQFWNASSNTASTSWPFSKISSATIPLRNACSSFANRSSFPAWVAPDIRQHCASAALPYRRLVLS